MNTRTPTVLALSIALIGLLIPIVPRLVVPLLRPYPYDDPYVGAGLARIGPLLAWKHQQFPQEGTPCPLQRISEAHSSSG